MQNDCYYQFRRLKLDNNRQLTTKNFPNNDHYENNYKKDCIRIIKSLMNEKDLQIV